MQAGVRQINTPGYGRKFEIRDSTSKVIQLEAANVETRDLWCASIQVLLATDNLLPVGFRGERTLLEKEIGFVGRIEVIELGNLLRARSSEVR